MARTEEVIEALTRLRKAARLTQRDLGGKMGVNHSTVASFERTGANPRLVSLLRYLEAAGATLTDLAGEIDKPGDPVQAAISAADHRLEDEPEYRRAMLEDLARFGTDNSTELQQLRQRLEKLEREFRSGSTPGRDQPVPNHTEE